MVLARTGRKIRLLRTGLILLARIYRRDRNFPRLAGSVWRVGTRQGLIGLRQWIISATPADNLDPGPIPTPLAPPMPADTAGLYQAWLSRYDILGNDQLQAAKRHLASLDLPELLILAVITPGDLPSLDRMIGSWRASIHPGWQAAIVAPSGWSPSEHHLLRSAIAVDERIHVVTTAEEVEALRQSFTFVLLCFGATLLNSLSTYMFLEAATRTGAALVYSDHDHLAEDGTRLDPAFKPQFSPEYLRHYNYIGDCFLISRAAGWTAAESAELFGIGAMGFDGIVGRLVRASDQNKPIEHLPFLLFHSLRERPRRSENSPIFATTGPRVSIIIPRRAGLDHLKRCLESILSKTIYDPEQVEIVIVDHGSARPETTHYLQEIAARPNLAVVRHLAPSNISEINNLGAAAAHGAIFVFLDAAAVVYDPDWLGKLVGYAQKPGVGAVGGKVLLPDGEIQHGGWVAGGSMGTIQPLLTQARQEDVAVTDHTREMSVLTGGCLAVSRDVFQKLGGFDPVLRTTWSDVKFCLSALSVGLRNIYIADPLLTRDELKTREADDTRQRFLRSLSEGDYTRRQHRQYFYDDPSYNPNLSLEQVGDLAEPPRVRLPSFRVGDHAPRILLLSIVYNVGYGVPVVMQQHARKLLESGYEVVIGGPAADNELSFPGCERVVLNSAQEATTYALTRGIVLVVSHTPPFFEVPILIGGRIPVLAHDHGEPPADLFQGPTRDYLLKVGDQKRRAAVLTTRINAISQSVKDEGLNKDAVVVGNANSHLPAWSETLRPMRERFREERGWHDKFVVLTVCRFREGERAYKGLDKIAEIMREFCYLYPEQSRPLLCVLAGAGTETDVKEVEALGFTVFANVSNAMLADLYKAADAYMSFSKWEGYNLGIGQALAMGLPTLGSDIPAHREFGIKTTNSVLIGCEWLAAEVERRAASTPGQRIAKIYDWDRSAAAFVAVVEDMLRHSAS